LIDIRLAVLKKKARGVYNAYPILYNRSQRLAQGRSSSHFGEGGIGVRGVDSKDDAPIAQADADAVR
jgi:hypothetical protein